jgi:3-mercaptopyruvate sulfurtransferase SseA
MSWSNSSSSGYAHPEVLVDTQWVEDHTKDSNVRIAEVDYDPKANYQLGHVPGFFFFCLLILSLKYKYRNMLCCTNLILVN